WIRGNPALHTHDAEDVHREERQVEPDEHEPEVPRRDALAVQASSELREPVVARGKDRENAAAEQHVVDMRDDEIRVVQLIVDRYDRRVNPTQAAYHEHRQKTD